MLGWSDINNYICNHGQSAMLKTAMAYTEVKSNTQI